LQAGQPVRLTPSADRQSIELTANSTAIEMDVEVTHTNRFGETHVLESDGISVPALAKAGLRVDKLSDLARPGAKPLILELKTGNSAAHIHQLGRKLNGPAVVTAHRIITRPHIGNSGVHAVEIKVAAPSKGSSPVRYRSLYGPSIENQESGKLQLSVEPGTRPLRIVAEDAQGKRSFPRTVFVTVPHTGSAVVPALKMYGEHTTILPGTTGEIPLGVYLPDFEANRIEFDFSVRTRLSGMGGVFPALIANGFTLSPELVAANATVNATVGLGGKVMQLTISWDPAKKKTGRFAIGTMKVAIPAEAGFGNTFLLDGKGTASLQTAVNVLSQPMQAIAPLIRIWGGPEPTKLQITGPNEVVEGSEIELTVVADGIPVQQAKAGWWANSMTGKVSVSQLSPGSLKARITGRNAGFVKVFAVVGTTVCETRIRVKAYVRPIFRRA
jgi:hypothetical protein